MRTFPIARAPALALLFICAGPSTALASVTANPQSITTIVNTAKAITLTATDTQNKPITYSIMSNPAHGLLSGTAPNLTYTPSANYTGSDSFIFRATNGSGGAVNTDTATIAITVTSPAPPTATGQSVTTNFNTAKAITLVGSDPNSLPLTYSIVTLPLHGTLSGTGANRVYTPAPNYSGPDSFTFKVNNGFSDSPAATVSIMVNAPGAPTAANQTVTTSLNTSLAIVLSGSDPNGLSLTYRIVTGPAHGALSGTAPNVTYTPTSAYSGTDSFTFTTSNGLQASNTATVSIAIEGPTSLDAPTINISGPLTLNDILTVTPSPCCIADYYNWTFIPLSAPAGAGSPAGAVNVPRASADISLGALGLHIGTYQVRVHGIVGAVTSPDAVATLTILSNTLSGMRVYPNPWRSDRDLDIDITFDHLTPGARIKIFDMAAHWVRTLNADSDAVAWNRRNDNGDLVASGMYLYVVTDSQGEKIRGKLTLIK